MTHTKPVRTAHLWRRIGKHQKRAADAHARGDMAEYREHLAAMKRLRARIIRARKGER